VTKIVVDESRIDHEVHRVRYRGADEVRGARHAVRRRSRCGASCGVDVVERGGRDKGAPGAVVDGRQGAAAWADPIVSQWQR
jgi:hypothetical protein